MQLIIILLPSCFVPTDGDTAHLYVVFISRQTGPSEKIPEYVIFSSMCFAHMEIEKTLFMINNAAGSRSDVCFNIPFTTSLRTLIASSACNLF